jgi:hypothetical protein
MRRVPVFALLMFGCVKNGAEGMVILANTAPSGATCVFTGDPTQPAFSSGQIFVPMSPDVPSAYLLTPLIESRITPAGSGASVDRSILLQGANITLSATQNGASVSLASSSFSTPVSGSIPPGGTINVAFPIIPSDVLSNFATATTQTEVVANVTVFGTEGGGNVNAEPFTYGVTVCSTKAPCVVSDLGTCAGLAATVNLGNPCNPFQDGVVDCCEDGTDQHLICPAVAQGM